MSDDGTFTLQEMFTLENLITVGRDIFELRYSTDDDLKVYEAPHNANTVKAELTDWCFITLSDNRKGGAHVVFLTGVKNGLTATMTSPVVAYNRARQFVVTNSGSVYRLEGDGATVPLKLDRVVAIAATFNGWGIGLSLGMPPAFF